MSEKRIHLSGGGRLAGRRGKHRNKFGNPSLLGNESGYAKWAEPNTSTVAYDPSQKITQAKDADKGIAPSVSTPAPSPPSQQTTSSGGQKEQTVSDGDTDVVTSFMNRQQPQLGTLPAREKVHLPPCLNPKCKSYGKGHPNCLCYAGPNGSSLEDYTFAKGGVVGERFCSSSRNHNPKCPYYADGGSVQENGQQAIIPPDNIEDTIGHAAAEHGLLGFLQDVGHKKLQDHEKHTQKLASQYDPKKIIGTPLTGSISPNKLEPIMQRLQPAVSMKEPSSEAFRNSVDYLSSAMRGKNHIGNKASELFGDIPFTEKMEPDKDSREALKGHLQEIEQNPHKALEIGGMLGHYMPDHSAAIAAHAAQGMNYLKGLRPMQSQNGPLDTVSPIDKFAEEKYNRALDIANQPLMALHHAKEGTLQPQDVRTLSTLYPGLHKSIVKKIGESLIEAKMNGVEIPHKQRMSISMLIGQPLDSSFTPQSMQAIIKANAGAQMPQTQNNQGKPAKKASGTELKQINQVNEMAETPAQSRASNKKA